MKDSKGNRPKQKYTPPLLAKYDSLSKITLGTHVARGPCPNWPNNLDNASCNINEDWGGYKGGPNRDCCDT